MTALALAFLLSLLIPFNTGLSVSEPSRTTTIRLTTSFYHPQAFAVHDGVFYVLEPGGVLLTLKNGKSTYKTLKAGLRAGYISVDDEGHVHVLRNLMPLDTPRELTIYSPDLKESSSYTVHLNDHSKLKFTTPDGASLSIYPQTTQAIPLDDGYIITYSNGQRWFFHSPSGELRNYKDLVWEGVPGRLRFFVSRYPHQVNTTGRAVAFQFLGKDDKGHQYYSFVDFIDYDNQHLVVIKVSGNQVWYADVTDFADLHLDTNLAVDRAQGHVYAARRNPERTRYILTLIGSDLFEDDYAGFVPQETTWFHQGLTDPVIQMNIAAQTVNYLEKLLPTNPQYLKVDRHQVWETALEFVNYTWTPEAKNKTGIGNSLIGKLPRWLVRHKPGETVRGVVYNWGGSDSLEVFQERLDQGYQAGNVETSGPRKGGTTGVDCSGFVWLTYGYPSRPEGGTVLISSPRYWTRIQNKDLVWMDMVRKPGHVVLFVAVEPYNPDIFYTIESSVTFGNDTTKFWYRQFSKGYHGLRYNGLLIPHSISQSQPQACPDGKIQVVHRERITYPVTLPGGETVTKTWETQKVECSICLRQWLR